MTTQTIRVAAPLAAGTYWAYVQEDGSNTDVYGELAVTQEVNGLFWTFEINSATAGVYAFQIYENSGPLAAYGWFYSAADEEVTIQDQNSREDARLSSYVDAPITSRLGSNYEDLLDYLETIAGRLDTTWVAGDGSYLFTETALSNAPTGGGGSGSVIVYPLNASMPLKSVGLLMTFYTEESGVVMGPIGVTARSGNTIVPVDLSGRTLEVRFIDYLGTEILSIPDSDITISGADDDQFSFVVTTALTETPTVCHEDQYHYWTLRDITDGENVLLAGRARVLLS